ncbi:MAG: group III truncated hemoglobin [Saprospiraceae bacterium]|nr:group III truncated hemoglobin [Saprospiraceae bacterium]
MKRDISSLEDIENIIRIFYERVRSDNEIGFFFTEVVQINWERHIPNMCSFWESVLFYSGDYSGNPLSAHRAIHKKYNTQPNHFKKWLYLFNAVIDNDYSGPNAEKMKHHARSIALVMQKNITG